MMFCIRGILINVERSELFIQSEGWNGDGCSMTWNKHVVREWSTVIYPLSNLMMTSYDTLGVNASESQDIGRTESLVMMVESCAYPSPNNSIHEPASDLAKDREFGR